MAGNQPTNEEIAAVLDRIAALLEAQGASRFRVGAYRDGASTLRSTQKSAAEMVNQGEENALKDLPNIGDAIAGVVVEYVTAGRADLLNRLETESDPRQVFTQIPGVGPELAERIVNQLDVKTFEELEQAAHDGRLAQVPGFGPERIRSVRIVLAGMLSGAAQRYQQESRVRKTGEQEEQPSVGTLLAVDAKYREKAQAGELKRISPKRFNPQDEAWLPVMNEKRDGWNFTALFSNTAQAHQLGKTHDWVVIYYDRGGIESQVTVVTETSGALKGKRVVRGREIETERFYAS